MSRRRPRPKPGTGASQKRRKQGRGRRASTDILILSDGTVLAHNLTPGMAKVLHKLNPNDATIRARAERKPKEAQ